LWFGDQTAAKTLGRSYVWWREKEEVCVLDLFFTWLEMIQCLFG